MTLAAGTNFGPYEIVALLGAGGMGEVYKARDTRLDRSVAVKVLPRHVATDPDLKQRFEREAKILAALSHLHICPVFDVGQAVPALRAPTTYRLTAGAFSSSRMSNRPMSRRPRRSSSSSRTGSRNSKPACR
jgi:serine/threonine protein kinase